MEQFEGWEWFYLDDDAENVGPFTTQELVTFFSEGAITSETFGKFARKAVLVTQRINKNVMCVSVKNINFYSSALIKKKFI